MRWETARKKEIKKLDAEIEKNIAAVETALYGEEIRNALKDYGEKVLLRIKELDFYTSMVHAKSKFSLLISIIVLAVSIVFSLSFS